MRRDVATAAEQNEKPTKNDVGPTAITVFGPGPHEEPQSVERTSVYVSTLIRIDAVDRALDLHIIVDSYSTHKTKQVQDWLKRHKRFNLHFVPTSSSWLNLVERFFAMITQDAIRRGVFKSVADLEAAIAD